jgi:hypothetical protein
METFTYRQPLAGQALVNLVEGDHRAGGSLHSLAGRHFLVCCFGSRQFGPGRVALDALRRHSSLFDDEKLSFLGVSVNPKEMIENATQGGIHYSLDKEGLLSRQCGAAPMESVPVGMHYRVTWTVVDPTLHVVAHYHTGTDIADCEAVFAFVKELPDLERFGKVEIPAPILVLPRVFEPEFCEKLIELYESGTSRDSGFMLDNVEIFNASFKRRRDYAIEDEDIRQTISACISRCVNPEIRKLFFMKITRMERFLVGCYAAEDDAHFRPHRDNGQAVTAHRRYAVSVALNEDFEGGELMFPEYNRRLHKVPKGWCIVFPCGILHAVARVTKGRRYAFLPFLFDEEAAKSKVG